jgi:hypothetical protein
VSENIPADVNRGKRNPAESTLQLPPLGRGSFVHIVKKQSLPE